MKVDIEGPQEVILYLYIYIFTFNEYCKNKSTCILVQNYIPLVPSECIVFKTLLIVNVLVIKFSGLFLAIVNNRC